MATALDNPEARRAADKESLLLSIAGDRLDADGRNFVRVLVEADRIALLPQIRDAVRGAQGRGRRRGQGATIETAFPLTEATSSPSSRPRSSGASAQRSRRRSSSSPTLIGGARITVGDTVIDGTVQEQLRGDGHPAASLNRKPSRDRRLQRRRDARKSCN